MDINMPELRGAADELGIDLDNLLPAIEDAILGAYSKVPGAIRGAHVEIDRRTGHMSVLAPEVDDDDQPTGEYFDDTPDDFGRIAQATARSVIVQRIQDRRDFEVLGAFKDKTGELISGTVEQGRDPRIVYVRLDEEHEGIMPPHEQVPAERYRHGDRVRAYVTDVSRGTRGAQIILSRTHPGLVRKLFEREVPEISSGDVEIVSVAREAGHRTKMAVRSKVRGVNAKGACIGPMGQRVRAVMTELVERRSTSWTTRRILRASSPTPCRRPGWPPWASSTPRSAPLAPSSPTSSSPWPSARRGRTPVWPPA